MHDLRNVWNILPNKFTATLSPKNPAASDVTVAGANSRPLRQGEILALGGEWSTDPKARAFLLPVTGLGSSVPKNGDWITDSASVVWNIKSVDLELEGTVYRCLAVQNVSA